MKQKKNKLQEITTSQRYDFAQQQADLLLSNPVVQVEITKLRQELGIPLDGFKMEELAEEWKKENWYYRNFDNDNDPESPADKAITKILHEHHLPSGWHNSLKRYLFLNNPSDMQLPTEIRVHIINDEDTGQPEIHIIINETTTSDDVVADWHRVEAYKDKLPYVRVKKRQTIYNLKMVKRAAQLHKGGMKPAKIAVQLHEEGYKNHTGYEVSQWLKRHKKRVTKTP